VDGAHPLVLEHALVQLEEGRRVEDGPADVDDVEALGPSSIATIVCPFKSR
jgi:hypothetical protein